MSLYNNNYYIFKSKLLKNDEINLAKNLVITGNRFNKINETNNDTLSTNSSPIKSTINLLEKKIENSSIPASSILNQQTKSYEQSVIKVSENESTKYYTNQLMYGEFTINIALPTNTDVNFIKSTYDNGVLKIMFGKKQEIITEITIS